jgi:hypothetical protein
LERSEAIDANDTAMNRPSKVSSKRTKEQITIFGPFKPFRGWYEVVRAALVDEFKTNNDLHFSAFFAICIRISALKMAFKSLETSNETTIFPGGGYKELPFLDPTSRFEVVRAASADEFKTNK